MRADPPALPRHCMYTLVWIVQHIFAAMTTNSHGSGTGMVQISHSAPLVFTGQHFISLEARLQLRHRWASVLTALRLALLASDAPAFLVLWPLRVYVVSGNVCVIFRSRNGCICAGTAAVVLVSHET